MVYAKTDFVTKSIIMNTGDSSLSGKNGGIRPGAGRKSKYGEETVVMRIPLSQQSMIKDLLAIDLLNNEIAFTNKISDLAKQFPLTKIEARTKYAIPLVNDLIPASFPSPAADHIQDVIDLNELLIRNETATFFGRIGSDSMINEGFGIGDIAIFDRSIYPIHKDIVLAMIDNDFTLKQLMLCAYDESDCENSHGKPFPRDLKSQQSTPIWFKAANPAYANIYPKPGQQVEIIAVALHSVRTHCKRAR